MSDWEETTLGEIAQLSNGANFTKDDFGPGLKIIGVRDFGDRLFPNWPEVEEVRPSAISSQRQVLSEGDLVFVRSNGNPSLVGRCMLITKGPASTHSAFTIRARPDTDAVRPQFLAYQMRHWHRAGRMAAANGTNITNLNQTILSGVSVLVPNLGTQDAVVSVLGSLDDLIANNRRRVDLLEQMAQALYREWFVKFRYPGHEDASIVDSTVGPIPAGWGVGRVEDHLLLQRGFDLPTRVRNEGEVPVMAASGVHGTHSEAKVKGPGVVTGRSGTVGIVTYVASDFWPLNTVLWVREFRLATPLYAYCLLGSIDLRQSASGAAVPTLNRNIVHALPVTCPPAEIIRDWDARVQPMFAAAASLRCESTCVQAIRDFLLPKLVTGQIDVSNVDVETVVA